MEERTCPDCRTLLGRIAQLETLRASGTLNGSNYGASWSYDADGNMTSQTNIATGAVTYYTWDYRNRLVEVKQESSNGTVLNDEKFTYDVNNNRIAVSLNGTPQLYTVYDGANPYMDFNGSGQLTERYLTNPNALSQFYGQVNASGNVQWFLTDNIHSIRQVVSASGSVLDLITYDPYGNIINQTNAANAPRFLYAGGAYDSLTGYDQFGRRYYAPSDGRWTSQDPLGFKAGDTDLYRYVFNDPLVLIDPSGLEESKRRKGLPNLFPGASPPASDGLFKIGPGGMELPGLEGIISDLYNPSLKMEVKIPTPPIPAILAAEEYLRDRYGSLIDLGFGLDTNFWNKWDPYVGVTFRYQRMSSCKSLLSRGFIKYYFLHIESGYPFTDSPPSIKTGFELRW